MATPYQEIRNIEKVFLERKMELDKGSTSTRDYTEQQYVAQVVSIINLFKGMVLNGEFNIKTTSILNRALSVSDRPLPIGSIDNAIVLELDTNNEYEIQGIISTLQDSMDSGAINSNRNIILLPKGSNVLKAKLVLEEETDEQS